MSEYGKRRARFRKGFTPPPLAESSEPFSGGKRETQKTDAPQTAEATAIGRRDSEEISRFDAHPWKYYAHQEVRIEFRKRDVLKVVR